MTVLTTNAETILSYSGAGTYPYDFPIIDKTDMLIYHRKANGSAEVLTLFVDYNLTIDGDGTGDVTLTYNVSPFTGNIEMKRNLPITQATDWVNTGGLDLEQLETDFDRIILILQQFERQLDESINAYAWQGEWVTGTTYQKFDLVQHPTTAALYIANEGHTAAADIATDITAGRLSLVFDVTDAVDAAVVASGILGYAEEWANNDFNDPVSVDAGGDGSTTFSAKHWAQVANDGDFDSAINVGSKPWVVDEDDMVSDSEQKLPTQQSVKAYIDNALAAFSIIPIGVPIPYFGATLPTGYLWVNGAAVSRTTYSDLFAVLGTTWGVGDGSTTFNLPDARGRVLAGADNIGGIGAAGRITSNNTLGAFGGAETHSLTAAEGPAHTHTGSTNTTGNHTHSYQDEIGTTGSLGQSGTGRGDGLEGKTTGSNGNHSHSLTINSSGSGNPHNNLQPYLICNYIIKY